MHYLDPDRPRLGGPDSLPLLLNAPSRTVLPGLYLSPRGGPDAPILEVSAFFPFAGGGASRRELSFASPQEFLAFWARWLEDPEKVAVEEFSWKPGVQAKTSVIDDLSDLLDFL
jgi:hypothetical protein